MKRREFNILAGSSVAVAAATGRAAAQSVVPDPSLLGTKLTPYGANPSGNADGSIPPWTGGITAPALPLGQSFLVKGFSDETKLYEVNATNLSQYQTLVPPGLSAMITQFGFKLRVFTSHRTAAAPQYVYDNIKLNATRAKLDPAGGRFGFLNAYGGIPFPIIDTSNPLIGGAQLIWNHLTAWGGFCYHSAWSPSIVVSDGSVVLSAGSTSDFIYPYYDPSGTLEDYKGFYSKLLIKTSAPASAEGQQTLVWHSTNVTVTPDITWTLLNGQGRVRKSPNEAYDTPNPTYNGISNIDESQAFYGNPSEYDWTYIGKQEMLLPYNCNDANFSTTEDFCLSSGPNPDLLRFEKHRVWVVEAKLHPGERNVLAKRRFYIDEDTWSIVLGEAYSADEKMTRTYMNPLRFIPSLPMTTPIGIIVRSLLTGDYVFNGTMPTSSPQHGNGVYNIATQGGLWDPQQMAAQASF